MQQNAAMGKQVLCVPSAGDHGLHTSPEGDASPHSAVPSVLIDLESAKCEPLRTTDCACEVGFVNDLQYNNGI